jgi:hypothetical protein
VSTRFILSVFLLLLSFVGQAQSGCSVNKHVFRSGEKLSYQLYYNFGFVWIQAGHCEFLVRNATFGRKPVYQFLVQGRSQKSFDSFYKVRDTLISYVDTQTLLPMKAYKYTHEDRWHGIDEFTFKPSDGGFRISTRLMRKKVWKPVVESVTTQCGFDIVSSIYRWRCFSSPNMYKVGNCIDLPLRLDDGEYMIHLTYLGKERIKLYGSGYYQAHAFSLSIVEGSVFKRGDVLKLWLSDDENRIPLLVESPIKVGTVKAIFRGAEKTLHPLTKALAK